MGTGGSAKEVLHNRLLTALPWWFPAALPLFPATTTETVQKYHIAAKQRHAAATEQKNALSLHTTAISCVRSAKLNLYNEFESQLNANMSIWESALCLESSKHAPQVLGQELGDLCGSSQPKPCCRKSEELQEGQRGKEKKQKGCGQDAPALCRRSHIYLQQTQLFAWAWTRSICWLTLVGAAQCDAELCLPVDDAQRFVDGHTPTALLGLPVPLVFGIHILL